MLACLELSIASEPTSSLAEASQRLQDYLAQQGVGKRALYAADLAIEELGTNILSYGFPAGATAAFILRATVKPDRIELVFEDRGIAFDPSAAPVPKRSHSLAEATIGGLGIHMVRQAASRFSYSRLEERNHLEVHIARDGGMS